MNSKQNIVLIGMPGSGKTTLGKQAAKINKMEIVDIDSVIVKKYGQSIPEIFEAEGEDGFRAKETAVLSELANQEYDEPKIFSAGGGAITRPENIEILRKLGKIIYIHRDVEAIANNIRYSKDRPLLSDKEKLNEIWESRKGIYRAVADAEILNDGNYHEVVRRLARLIKETM